MRLTGMTQKVLTGISAIVFLSTAFLGFGLEVYAETITVTGVSSFRMIEPYIPLFEKETGITVNLQVLPYGQLRQKSMADLVGGTANSDVYLEDIIWLGEWATNGYVRPLDDLFERDRDEEIGTRARRRDQAARLLVGKLRATLRGRQRGIGHTRFDRGCGQSRQPSRPESGDSPLERRDRTSPGGPRPRARAKDPRSDIERRRKAVRGDG